MRRGMHKKGSALIMAIWTIAVVSVLVISFAMEAKLQSAANVYMRERVHMDHLIDAGRVLADHQIVRPADVKRSRSLRNGGNLRRDDRLQFKGQRFRPLVKIARLVRSVKLDRAIRRRFFAPIERNRRLDSRFHRNSLGDVRPCTRVFTRRLRTVAHHDVHRLRRGRSRNASRRSKDHSKCRGQCSCRC